MSIRDKIRNTLTPILLARDNINPKKDIGEEEGRGLKQRNPIPDNLTLHAHLQSHEGYHRRILVLDSTNAYKNYKVRTR
jgi:hypothetical protein